MRRPPHLRQRESDKSSDRRKMAAETVPAVDVGGDVGEDDFTAKGAKGKKQEPIAASNLPASIMLIAICGFVFGTCFERSHVL
jgi:hypothetical protein